MNNGIKRNGITISVEDWSGMGKKKPVLAVKIEDENAKYKVASFNSKETAMWFLEICEEFFSRDHEKPFGFRIRKSFDEGQEVEFVKLNLQEPKQMK